MMDHATPTPTGEKVYRYDIPALRRAYRRSALILVIAFVVLVGPMLCGVGAIFGAGESLTLIAIGPPLISLLILGLAGLYTAYAYYVSQHNFLILSPAGASDRSPIFKIYTPWSNVVRVGAVQLRTNNALADQRLAGMEAGRMALILRQPVAFVPTPHGLLGATFGRFILRQMRQNSRPYILLTYCTGLRPEDDLLGDIQQYAPHLVPHD